MEPQLSHEKDIKYGAAIVQPPSRKRRKPSSHKNQGSQRVRPGSSAVLDNDVSQCEGLSSEEAGTDAGPAAPDSDYRTILFAVRLEETVVTEDLAVDAFKEWFRKIPVPTKAVTCGVEGQFLCDSTLLILRVPISVWVCLRGHSAIIPLGPVKTSNILLATSDQRDVLTDKVTGAKRESSQDQTEHGHGTLEKGANSETMPRIMEHSNDRTTSASSTQNEKIMQEVSRWWHPTMDPSFTEPEKRFLLAEMIKVSQIDIGKLVEFVKTNNVEPEWLIMQLPAGRNMNQCIRSAEGLFDISTVYPPNTLLKQESRGKLSEFVPKWPATTNLIKPTAITVQPRPSSYKPNTSTSSPTLSTPGTRRKRGRPSKAEKEAQARANASHGPSYPPLTVTPVAPRSPPSTSREPGPISRPRPLNAPYETGPTKGSVKGIYKQATPSSQDKMLNTSDLQGHSNEGSIWSKQPPGGAVGVGSPGDQQGY